MGGSDKGASAPLMGKGKEGNYGAARDLDGGRPAPAGVPRAPAAGRTPELGCDRSMPRRHGCSRSALQGGRTKTTSAFTSGMRRQPSSTLERRVLLPRSARGARYVPRDSALCSHIRGSRAAFSQEIFGKNQLPEKEDNKLMKLAMEFIQPMPLMIWAAIFIEVRGSRVPYASLSGVLGACQSIL